jgi:hypothetical protein
MEMCEIICSTLNQLATGVVFYYQPVYPHHMDFHTGHMQYMQTLPRWFLDQGRLEQNRPIVFGSMSYSGELPSDVFAAVAIFLHNPSRLALCCPYGHRVIQIREPAIIQELADQIFNPARLIEWWGHRLWSAGRMPILNTPPEPSDARWLRELYQRWDREEEAYMRQEADRQGWLRDEEDGRFRNEEELRWYSSLNFFEQSVEEAIMFGERVPVGTYEDDQGIIHLLYSDDELEISELSSEVSE